MEVVRVSRSDVQRESVQIDISDPFPGFACDDNSNARLMWEEDQASRMAWALTKSLPKTVLVRLARILNNVNRAREIMPLVVDGAGIPLGSNIVEDRPISEFHYE